MDTNAIQKKQRTENRETRNQFQRVTSFRALEQSIVGRKRVVLRLKTIPLKNVITSLVLDCLVIECLVLDERSLVIDNRRGHIWKTTLGVTFKCLGVTMKFYRGHIQFRREL